MWPLIDQLVQQGVGDFFIASGSRSTPLVMAAAHHPKAKIHRHVDERALGFFALGCAQGKEAPVAIIVTSGTAVANLLPAVMEAHHSSTPLLLLTADRPAELREASAHQTTDQTKIFQNFVRWQFDLDPTMPEAAIRSKTAQAVFRATAHRGPVHLNCPLREPLYHPTQKTTGQPIALELGRKSVSKEYPLPPRGLILIGRLCRRSDLAPILSLAKQLAWPVFADVLSNGRLFPTEEQIGRFDWILPEAPLPECILHFGERLLSKRLLEWMPKVRYIHISPHAHWYDPIHNVTERIDADEVPRFSTESDPTWLQTWIDLDRGAEERLSSTLAEAPFTESKVFHFLSSREYGAIFLGASMPVREADWFLFPKKTAAFFSNRGVAGIDGNIATAAGIAAGLKTSMLAIVGDLTALHDLNSLQLVKQSPYPITLLISNNGGGGIFSHLPISQDARFEELFAFEHDIQFKHAAAMFGLPYFRVEELSQWPTYEGSCVIEVMNLRADNTAFHRHLKSFFITENV